MWLARVKANCYSRRRSPPLAQIRNRHVLDEVFAQNGHFLLWAELSAGFFHGRSFWMPHSVAQRPDFSNAV